MIINHGWTRIDTDMSENKLGFEELKKEIAEAPATWLPALFLTVVEACLKNNVFQKGAMGKYCHSQEKMRE